jgi:hypothetical protein
VRINAGYKQSCPQTSFSAPVRHHGSLSGFTGLETGNTFALNQNLIFAILDDGYESGNPDPTEMFAFHPATVGIFRVWVMHRISTGRHCSG